MKHKSLWASVFSLAFLASCGGEGEVSQQQSKPDSTSPQTAQQVSAQKPSAGEQAVAVYADFFEADLALNPLRATFVGDPRYNDQLPNNLSAEFIEQVRVHHQTFLDRINAIDSSQLSDQDLLSYEIFKFNRERGLEQLKYPSHLQPINQFFSFPNFFAVLGSGSSAQPFNSVKDYDNWIKRAGGFPVIIDQAIANMREGMNKGIVRPKVLMEKVLPQLAAHVVDDVTQSTFYQPVQKMPADFSDEDKQRLTEAYTALINDQLIPAYQRLHDFIRDEYLPSAQDAFGLGALPGGQEWYAFLVKNTTTTDLTPDEIHQIGLNEVARIHGEMRKVMAETGFDGDLKDFFEFTKTDPQFIYESREAMLQDYRAFRDTVDQLTPKLFSMFPKADYEVRAVEAFRERSASGASYQRAAPDGSRPGIFYVNTYDLSARPKWGKESLFLHEAAPGHHFQLAIQQELDALPKFRRFGSFTAYVEGWGLYAESLGKELGVYQDPYQYFGALSAELWRAIRLVTDTGIHAKGWTRQKVLDYMYDNAPVAEARAVSEAERFAAIPSQALAYKIGQLKIRELRNRAEQALGDRFDVKDFHAQVLKDGSLPLGVLEAKIDRWIEQVGAE